MRHHFQVLTFIFVLGGSLASYASVGPFTLYSSDSSSHIRFQLVGQLRSELKSLDRNTSDDRKYEFYTKFRRIRPTLSGTVFKPAFTFKLHLSTAPGSLELMDLYFNYKVSKFVQVRYGQFKIPFTRYRIQSFQNLTFTDWAIVTKYFGGERQVGLAVHNGYENPPRWAYALGVFNGANARASHAIGIAEIYNEDTPNPSDLTNPAPVEKFHPEIVGHGSFNTNGVNVQSDSDDTREKFRYSGGISLAYDFEPVKNRDFSLRLAVEGLVKYRGLSFTSVGYAGYFKKNKEAKTEPALTGGLFQSAYRLNERYEISFRYALVDARKALLSNAENYLEEEDIARLLIREEELTVGVNIYLAGHSLKWQVEAGGLKRTYYSCSLTDYTVRVQGQLSF